MIYTSTTGPGFCSIPPIISKIAKTIEIALSIPSSHQSYRYRHHATPRETSSTGTHSLPVVPKVTTHCLHLGLARTSGWNRNGFFAAGMKRSVLNGSERTDGCFAAAFFQTKHASFFVRCGGRLASAVAL